MGTINRALLASAAAAAVMQPSAQAQSTGMAADESADRASSGQVQDIIVTAQRRSERLQDVPLAVTAVQAEELTALGVESAMDLRIAAPALNSSNGNGVLVNSIRGVGSFTFAPGVESPVAMYVDGVYLAAPQASELTLNNISAVEVLKGPQGTLFGRNATAGLIHIKTSDPDQVARGNFSLSYGNYDTIVGSAYVSGGLAPNFAADIAFSGKTQRDGFGTNRTTGADVGDIHHDIALRSKWLWTPGPDTRVTLIGTYWDGRDTRGTLVARPGTLSPYIPGYVSPDLGYGSENNVDLSKSGWSGGASLKVEHDFGGVSLSSISAYRKGKLSIVNQDIDYTAFEFLSGGLGRTDRQFSQELQLSSAGSSRLKWTAGLYYFDIDGRYDPFDVTIFGTTIAVVNAQRSKSYAAYGQASYEIAEGTNLTVGGRYTHERRKEHDASLTTTLQPGNIVIPIAYPDRSVDFGKFTYRISLDHRFSDAVMIYASLNTGFKSGGFNTSTPGDPSFRPETLKAYEVGLKTDLLDRRLRFNAAGFYYDYTDIQVQSVDNAFAVKYINGAAARVYGLEAEFTAVISDAFSLTGGATWLDPKYKEFDGCIKSTPGGGVPISFGSCAGARLPFAAKFSGSLAATYKARVGGGEVQASANVYYNSGYFFQPDNVDPQRRYAKLNSTIKWTSDDGFSVGVFGRNLTDRRTYLASGPQASGSVLAVFDEPRTYGVTLGFEF